MNKSIINDKIQCEYLITFYNEFYIKIIVEEIINYFLYNKRVRLTFSFFTYI